MPSPRALLIAFTAVSLIAVACGTEPVAQIPTADADNPPNQSTETATAPAQPTPTAQPTAVPTANPTPISPTPAATMAPEPNADLEVNILDAGLTPPSTPSVFEALLARIPDTELTRGRVMLSDIAAMRDIASIEQPAPGVGTDGLGDYFDEIAEARDEGLVGHIGVTGHNWTIAAMHKRSLERFDFDSVLLPCNFPMMQRPEYRQDFSNLLALCGERSVAVQLIKTIARGPWATTKRYRTTWYQPLEEQEDIDRGVHYGMSQGNVFLNTAGDLTLLPKFLDAASRYETRPSDEAMEAMLNTQKMTSIFGL